MVAEVAVRPVSPRCLPRHAGGDLVLRRHGPWLERLLVVDDRPMVVRARQGEGEFIFGAEPVDPLRLEGPGADRLRAAGEDSLRTGIDRLRFSLGLDDDLREFREAFGKDPQLGPALRSRLGSRPLRRAAAWEALLWAITEQLIEYRRAARIQRQLIRKYGIRFEAGMEISPAAGPVRVASGRRYSHRRLLATVPSAGAIAAAAPAGLEACGLAGRRAIAMVKVAREVASGRVDPEDSSGDRRLLAIPEIGPWTLACLGLRGRGDEDALLAGDLGQVKLVGYLRGLGRLAEVDEVREFYAPYAPWRGLAGDLLLMAHGAALHGPGNRARIRQRARGQAA